MVETLFTRWRSGFKLGRRIWTTWSWSSIKCFRLFKKHQVEFDCFMLFCCFIWHSSSHHSTDSAFTILEYDDLVITSESLKMKLKHISIVCRIILMNYLSNVVSTLYNARFMKTMLLLVVWLALKFILQPKEKEHGHGIPHDLPNVNSCMICIAFFWELHGSRCSEG